MRHFDHIAAERLERLFHVQPQHFDRDGDPAVLAVALGATLQELRRRVETQPEVAGVAFADRLPGDERPDRFVELAVDPQRKAIAVRFLDQVFTRR